MSPNELSELAPLAKTLNDESNDLNKTIATLNQQIAALNLGIEIWLNSEESEDYQLGFGKVRIINDQSKHKWELAVRTKMFNGNRFQQPTALLEASRDLRIEGLGCVPALLDRLKKAASDKIRVMQEAKKLAAELSEPASTAEKSTSGDRLVNVTVAKEPSALRAVNVGVFSEGALDGIREPSETPLAALDAIRMASKTPLGAEDAMRAATESPFLNPRRTKGK
jgi:hypothetical protein